MIRRRPAPRMSVVYSVLITLPLASACLSGAACVSEPRMQTADRASTSTQENAANVRVGERGTKGDNAPAAQSGVAKPAGSSEEAPAGVRAASDNQPSSNANGGPDPNPAQSVAAGNDGLDFDSLREGGPLVIAIAAVGLVVVVAVICIVWMLFRRKSGIAEQSGRSVQGNGPWSDPVNPRQVDEPNPRSATASHPPDFIAAPPSGHHDQGKEVAELAGEIKQLRLRVERLESLEQRVNEINKVVASLNPSDELTGAAKAREVKEADEASIFILEQPEASLTPGFENRMRQLSFPSRASEYLALVRERGLNCVLATKAMLPGALKRAEPGPKAAFMLLDEGVPGAGRYLALPNRLRLAEAQEYHTHYLDFYDCASPSSGNLIVQSAAVVRESGGEWTLETRGVLAVEE